MRPTSLEFSWHDYLEIFLRRKLFFIAPLVLALSVSIFMSLTKPKIYKAQTAILIQEEKTQNPLIEGLKVYSTAAAIRAAVS